MPGVRLVKANDSRRPPGRRRTRPDRLTFCCDAPAAGHAAILESRSSYVTVSEHRAQDNATFVTSQAPLSLVVRSVISSGVGRVEPDAWCGGRWVARSPVMRMPGVSRGGSSVVVLYVDQGGVPGVPGQAVGWVRSAPVVP